jgi:spore germination protein GerM
MKIIVSLILLVVFPIAVFSQTMTVKVYFSNTKFDPNMEDCNKVFPVTRKIAKTKAVAKAVLEELFRGVTAEEKEKGYWSLFSKENEAFLISVNVKKKAAYVNFKDTVVRDYGSATTSCGAGFIAQIETTLKQFPTVKKVFYAIEGNPEMFYGWIQADECPKELKKCSGKDFR